MFPAKGGLPDRPNHRPYCRDSADRCQRLPEIQLLKNFKMPIL